MDQVQFTYDGWGNVTKVEQDHNSAVGTSGSVDDYEVAYTYAKSATSGERQTVRRTAMTMPGSPNSPIGWLVMPPMRIRHVSRSITKKM